MGLLSKFDTVTIETDTRITEEDRSYCDTHQRAYEAALVGFGELACLWADLENQQRALLNELESEAYARDAYLPVYSGALEISEGNIQQHRMSLHGRFLRRLVHHFNGKYHVSVDADVVAEHLLPQKPNRHDRPTREQRQAYEDEMLALHLNYKDILNEIFVQLDGRDFREQAVYELKQACHQAAWNGYKRTASYEVKKDVLCFPHYACNYKTWLQRESWELLDDLKCVLRGIAHYETDDISTLPYGFYALLGYSDCKTNVMEFSTCTKVKQLRLFKNGRADIKFTSAQALQDFVRDYLGLVY